MTTLYTAKTQVRGGRDGSVKTEDGRLEARLAFPKSMGGDGNGLNPEQLFGAGYGACFASTIAAVAKAEGHPLKDVEVDAEVSVLHEQGTYDLGVRLSVKASGADRATLQGIIDKAKQVCPYSRATRNTLSTTVEIKE